VESALVVTGLSGALRRDEVMELARRADLRVAAAAD